MPQRVIVEPFRIDAVGPQSKAFEPDPTTLIGKALADGWRVVRTDSTLVEGLSTLYITFVVEKQ